CAAGVLAPAAQAHEGTITITCSQVTFHYTKFSPGMRTATEKVSVEGGATQTKSFTFSGAEATDTVAFTPALTGSPPVTANADWEGGGTGFEVTKTEKLSCSSLPPPTCPNNSIVSNFNGTKIQGGDFIWFNSMLKAKGVPASGGTITFTGQTVKIGSITVSSPPPRDATI